MVYRSNCKFSLIVCVLVVYLNTADSCKLTFSFATLTQTSARRILLIQQKNKICRHKTKISGGAITTVTSQQFKSPCDDVVCVFTHFLIFRTAPEAIQFGMYFIVNIIGYVILYCIIMQVLYYYLILYFTGWTF